MAVDESLGSRGEQETTPSDVVRLTLPSDGEFLSVARIVVGGLAARNDLSYEALDDLQLAVESILGEPANLSGAETTLEITIAAGQTDIVIGPVDDEVLRSRFAKVDGVGLRMVLGAVVDGFAFEERDGEMWLRLEKRVPPLTQRA